MSDILLIVALLIVFGVIYGVMALADKRVGGGQSVLRGVAEIASAIGFLAFMLAVAFNASFTIATAAFVIYLTPTTYLFVAALGRLAAGRRSSRHTLTEDP